MLSETKVGPQFAAASAGDGTVIGARADKTGATVVTDAHARFHEAAVRGQVFTVSVPVAGFTATAAAPGTPMLALWNPVGSGRLMSVLSVDHWAVSGTAAGVAGYYQLATFATPPAGFLTVASGGLGTGAASVARAYSNTALAVTPVFMKVGASYGTGALGFPPLQKDVIDGAIMLTPGSVLAITTSAVGTTFVVGAGITWEELAA